MKYTIEGFSQEQSVRLGLDAISLILLRWLVDFYNTDKMKKVEIDSRMYFWVHYKTIIENLPILRINNVDVMARRLKRLCECRVLSFKLFKEEGNKTYYKFNSEILELLLKSGISYSKVGRVPTQRSEGSRLKSRKQLDSSITNSSISNTKAPNALPVYFKLTEKEKKELAEVAALLIKKYKFNVFSFIGAVTKKSKYFPPIDKIITIAKNALKANPKNIWAYFTQALKVEMPKSFAQLRIAEGKEYKDEYDVPESIKAIMAKALKQKVEV